MYLLLDNSKAKEIILSLYLNNKWVQHIYSSQEVSSLEAIDKCLNDESVALKDLKGLAVMVGVGSFTATRISVTIANTMAYALGIKVVAINKVDEVDLINKIESASVGVLVSAVYSGEPNIGKKRSA